jgi:hypothetical protein
MKGDSKMQNNMNQQPQYGYGYPINPYQRMMSMQMPDAPQVASPQPYSAPMMMPQVNYIKGRPVVSIDEARASQIDLDGSLYVFPDLGNKKIYTKQINMDGTAAFNVFELVVPGGEAPPAPSYITREELDEILNQFKNSLVQTKPRETTAAPKPTFNL